MRPQPGRDQLVVVVARHHDHLGAARHPGADRAQRRLGDLHRLRGAVLEQLDHVAEQHQPVGALERAEQRVEGGSPPQHVSPQAGAEVEVRDDKRAHVGATMTHAGRQRSRHACA